MLLPKRQHWVSEVPCKFVQETNHIISTNPTPDYTFKAKPYWANWNKLPEIPEEPNPPAPELEPVPPAAAEEPLPGVPIEVAQRNHMSHQVQTDKPAPYMHKTSSAHHMDSLESPYAVFSFKYRSSGKLSSPLT